MIDSHINSHLNSGSHQILCVKVTGRLFSADLKQRSAKRLTHNCQTFVSGILTILFDVAVTFPYNGMDGRQKILNETMHYRKHIDGIHKNFY